MRGARSFLANARGAAAIEFAIVAMPFLLLVLMIIQMGIYYMAKASLDTGVVQTADSLVNQFYSASTPTIPTAAALKTLVYSKSGAMVHNDSNFYVELRKFSTLSSGPVAYANTVDASNPGDILALRARAGVVLIVPFLNTFATVSSSALVRRQGH